MRHVLFLCLGNSVRSQMAEGFARRYGHDLIRASSAGLSPATFIAPFTRQVMAERNISLDDHVPKPLNMVDLRQVDLIVNMTGGPLIGDLGMPVEEWRIEDPVGQSMDKFRQVADEVERRVMLLIMRLRQGAPAAAGRRRTGRAENPARLAAAEAREEPVAEAEAEAAHKPLPPKFGRPRIPRP